MSLGLKLGLTLGAANQASSPALPGPVEKTDALTYWSTPDSAANSITGDIDIRFIAALADLTPALYVDMFSKYGSSPNAGWTMRLQPDGHLDFFNWSNGSTLTQYNGDAAVGAGTNGFRVTVDVSTGDVTMYESDDLGDSWTQLGSVINKGATALFDSTAPIWVGNGNSPRLLGDIYKAEIYDGIDGTLAVSWDSADVSGTSWVSSATGETWTEER